MDNSGTTIIILLFCESHNPSAGSLDGACTGWQFESSDDRSKPKSVNCYNVASCRSGGIIASPFES